MATAPFSLNVTIPGDTDIVSQFPGVDRTHLDILNSWLKTDHNVNGTHNFSTYLQVGVADSGGNTASAPSPATNNTAIYRDTDGALKAKNGTDSTVAFLGVPPGCVMHTASSSLPVGWLWADGTAVSRTTYARLFAAISTQFGGGDGSTTFNLPQVTNRIIAGTDTQGTSLITAAGCGVDGTVLGARGGIQYSQLSTANLPPYTPSGSVSSSVSGGTLGNSNTSFSQVPSSTFPAGINPATITVTSTFTGNAQGGTSTIFSNVPPIIVLNPIIKY